MLRKLLLLSFVEGAAVMAAELCGAKLLAPIYGSSLFVWASVMGITLAALAGGYFFGGWLSTLKTPHSKTLFQILALASLFVLLMPVLAFYLVPRISYLPFLPGVVLSTTALLFPPVFFLGASSPLFIVVQTSAAPEAGHVSGTVYAVSTVGGIISTFLCGFYMIPALGLNMTLILFGGILFVMNMVIFRAGNFPQLFCLLIMAYLNYSINRRDATIKYSSDGILGRLDVRDIPGGKDTVRLLLINDIIQTEMDLKSRRSVSAYISLLDTLIPFTTSSGTALVLGLGGGLTANILLEKNYVVEGVEFDERIIQAAQNFFFLPKSVKSIHQDARLFLNQCDKKYDVILADLFKAEEQPSHVFTLESLLKLKKNLQKNGKLLISWHGYLAGERGKGSVILLNTLREAGYSVKLTSRSGDESFRNIVFVAAPDSLPALPYEIKEEYEMTAFVNSDNYPRLEKYNAEANKAWRTQYLRYYQRSGKP
jgi:predicted membrane-bound spermidine synthase